MVNIHNNTTDKVLKLLLSNRERELTIRAIAIEVAVDYKTVYLIVKGLIENKIINAKKIGQTILCTINNEFNAEIFRAEYIRQKELLAIKDLHVLYQRIKHLKKPFFTLLLFGSYATGKQKKGSDIDLMLITDDNIIKKEIKHIVSITPLNIHLLDFSSEEFLSMLKTTEFNVGREAFNNNVILFGIEDYYRLINNA